MVKKIVSGTGEKGKVRVRFFEIEMEGGTETLQDSVRALTAALNRPSGRVASPTYINRKAEAAALDAGEDDIESEETDDSSDDAVELTEAPAKTVRQRSKRTPPTPKVLEDISFDDVEPTWHSYALAKGPESDTSKIAVVGSWFKRYKAIDVININHAYTAFRMAEWPTPDDIGQCFRNAKRANNWFGTDGEGNWTINIIGLNAVDKMKSRAESKS